RQARAVQRSPRRRKLSFAERPAPALRFGQGAKNGFSRSPMAQRRGRKISERPCGQYLHATGRARNSRYEAPSRFALCQLEQQLQSKLQNPPQVCPGRLQESI